MRRSFEGVYKVQGMEGELFGVKNLLSFNPSGYSGRIAEGGSSYKEMDVSKGKCMRQQLLFS